MNITSSPFLNHDRSISAHSQASTESGTSTKKRKVTHDNDNERNACWPTILDSIHSRSAHEEFGFYVSSSLAQINDDHLIKMTKCKILLILAQAVSESAEKQLKSCAKQVIIFAFSFKIRRSNVYMRKVHVMIPLSLPIGRPSTFRNTDWIRHEIKIDVATHSPKQQQQLQS